MNHKLFSSLTASLLIASLGVPPSTSANPSESIDQGSEPNLNHINPDANSKQGENLASTLKAPSVNFARTDQSLGEVEKVGEQQPTAKSQTSTEVIAKIHPHEVSGRKAATLYVRNLPVLTLVSSTKAAKGTVKMGTQGRSISEPLSRSKSLKSLNSSEGGSQSLATLLKPSQNFSAVYSNFVNPDYLDGDAGDDNPIWQATKIAAKLNQLHQSGMGADKITVQWDDDVKQVGRFTHRYRIKADQSTIAVLDSSTQFPNTTRNLEYDALRATNRLRQLIGNAAPLKEVIGKPAPSSTEFALGPVRFKLTGMASWYGPGFHGNQSASGEIFNQHAMTAAHRTLPFGTRVLVTNLDNGQSVVVRINDRGPFHGNRIIDLSTAAARVLGVVSSGVAPVRLEVLDNRSASTKN
jgi:rare lipoprotein A